MIAREQEVEADHDAVHDMANVHWPLKTNATYIYTYMSHAWFV